MIHALSRRAGHPQDGRAGEEDPGHLRHLRGRHRGHRRHPAAGRLLLEGRDPLVRASPATAAARRCCGRVASLTALLTAFYMFRLLWLTFFGALAHGRTRSSTTCTSRRCR
ncbi:MAG: hypothetical protein MZV64_44640 [Ignavibacteriales bacterium]|nr:hypothetical protein [Ignavibacteriales bacterium]